MVMRFLHFTLSDKIWILADYGKGKASVLPKLIFKFNIIINRIPRFLIDTDKLILKFMWKYEGTRITKIMKKRIEWEKACYLILRYLSI